LLGLKPPNFCLPEPTFNLLNLAENVARLVLLAFTLAALPLLPMVLLKATLLLRSLGLAQVAGLDTILPLRMPDVHLYLRVNLPALRPHTLTTDSDTISAIFIGAPVMHLFMYGVC